MNCITVYSFTLRDDVSMDHLIHTGMLHMFCEHRRQAGYTVVYFNKGWFPIIIAIIISGL